LELYRASIAMYSSKVNGHFGMLNEGSYFLDVIMKNPLGVSLSWWKDRKGFVVLKKGSKRGVIIWGFTDCTELGRHAGVTSVIHTL
jgi:hypothetical protein